MTVYQPFYTPTYLPGSAWLSYDASLSRVLADTTAIQALIGSDDTVELQRSPDTITWTTVRGASAVAVTSSSPPVSDYEFVPDVLNYYRAVATLATYPAFITPDLGGQVFLKNLRYPFLNMAVKLADAGDITRPANGTTFLPLGQSHPVAIPVVRSARQFTLTVETSSDTETASLDDLLSTGDLVFLQVPGAYPVPALGGYYYVGDTTETRNGVPWGMRWTDLALTEAVPPSSEVTPITSTWASVVSEFATWADVPAGLGTWADVVSLVGAPGDVVTA